MKHYCDEWIQEWCEGSGWTEPVLVSTDFYWAFPPNSVMPEPIPGEILRLIKSEKGLTKEEKTWLTLAILISLISGAFTYFWHCPLPLVVAFAFSAVTAARLEIETPAIA
ncbi:hypothetical protein NIES970_13100 [[Synechococcus] sp. NIES-970]|uniref:slr1957 family protein n=1 Tax=Picosynechococcus sp. NKBG15041c TaxID=1407650 RepID=UPI000407D9A8|nr:hypothetical protein [Picosynechococcus sp. NKBG15041c]BAW96382.1 hypothetical protein NIES970_13100 [[Synechococcus] sp. NIES-970]